MTIFGQVVIGPPGSGKSTYCKAMKELLTALGRNVAVVNLDPGNDVLPYDSDVNVSDLITLVDVMENLKLGPNGGLVYCMEYLEANYDWLIEKLQHFKDCYILFDCPGQVELYTHHMSVRNIVHKLQEKDFRLAAVHLVDSHYCSDPSKFISVLLTSLSTMVLIELPHVNILSKVDLIEQFGKLNFALDYYTEVLDLKFILDELQDDPVMRKFKKLNMALISVIEDYSLVSFSPLNVQDKETMLSIIKKVDGANGYVFGGKHEEGSLSKMLSYAAGADFEYFKFASMQEKYVDVSKTEA
ncbi:GPN-loop GTPase 2-like [Xenia sp. Carnegie-2017]|uniref:GPN-loop GTPase 2-like n=1 Tax=Xenia sp. Carnegie-2017 TaxID=2897299 RepID=UPI001F045707|nr:GPN-loop GTPase 2-like [Xenia sp. Carnegie-2017]